MGSTYHLRFWYRNTILTGDVVYWYMSRTHKHQKRYEIRSGLRDGFGYPGWDWRLYHNLKKKHWRKIKHRRVRNGKHKNTMLTGKTYRKLTDYSWDIQ